MRRKGTKILAMCVLAGLFSGTLLGAQGAAITDRTVLNDLSVVPRQTMTDANAVQPVTTTPDLRLQVTDAALHAAGFPFTAAYRPIYVYGQAVTGEQDVTGQNVIVQGGSLAGVIAGVSTGGAVRDNSLTVEKGSFGTLSGGNSLAGPATINRVILKGDALAGTVYGGKTERGYVSGNRVTVTGATATTVYGGQSQSGGMIANAVHVSDEAKTAYVYGGRSESGAVRSSVVTFSDSTALTLVGGRSASGDVLNNRVTLTDGTVRQYILGGQSEDGLVKRNQVILEEGTVNTATGGQSENGQAVSNIAVLNGATVSGALIGGWSGSAKAEKNCAILKSGKAREITGGQSLTGTGTHNIAAIDGGTILRGAYGARGLTADLSHNEVALRGGHSPIIYGAWAEKGGNVSDNTVFLEKGTFQYVAAAKTDDGTARDNTVIWRGGNFKHYNKMGDWTVLAGASMPSASAGEAIDNKLFLHVTNRRVDLLTGFQRIYVHIPANTAAGDTILTLTGKDTPTDLRHAHVYVTLDNASQLKPGDTVRILYNPAGLVTEETTLGTYAEAGADTAKLQVRLSDAHTITATVIRAASPDKGSKAQEPVPDGMLEQQIIEE